MPKRHAVRRSHESVVARIEEIVLAASGADAFELVFSLVVARLGGRGEPKRGGGGRGGIAKGLRDAARRWPGLDASASLDVPDSVLETVGSLLDRVGLGLEG